MTNTKHLGHISCTRNSRDNIRIRIDDANSRQKITEVTLTLEAFALMVTGLCEIECQHETTKDVSNIGKTKVSEARTIVAPYMGYNRETYEQWLEENAQEDGYSLNTYLGSKTSIKHCTENDTIILNYTVYKYE